LNGPLATEVNLSAAINSWMMATFNLRLNADGSVRTEVTIANDSAYNPWISTQNYDAVLTNHGQVLFANLGVSQFPDTTWHAVGWSGAYSAAPADQIVLDPAYLASTGAIQNYDMSRSEEHTSELQSLRH